MASLIDRLKQDVRYREGLNACMNCGICTAVCPAAAFYRYDPRIIISRVQEQDDAVIEELLKGEEIWYCGQCMSCRTRCPRDNTPGYVIMALRKLSQETGLFTESEKGRQQWAIRKTVGENILTYGYCIHPETTDTELHPELGPVWEWVCDEPEYVFNSLGGNFMKPGSGGLRKISEGTMHELSMIFKVSGGEDFFNVIEKHSIHKAQEMGYNRDDLTEYFYEIISKNSDDHYRN